MNRNWAWFQRQNTIQNWFGFALLHRCNQPFVHWSFNYSRLVLLQWQDKYNIPLLWSIFCLLFLSFVQVDKGEKWSQNISNNKVQILLLASVKLDKFFLQKNVRKEILYERKLHFSSHESSCLVPVKFPWKLQGHPADPALFVKGKCCGFRFAVGSYHATHDI